MWARGTGAAQAETELAFRNKLQSRLLQTQPRRGRPDGGTWLRTGDLGMYLDGELYITGRMKDMVIVDGRNHYPQDLEATAAEASKGVQAGFVPAFSVPSAHARTMVVVAERAAARDAPSRHR